MIIFRYLAKEVLITMVAVSAVLLLIIMSGRFISYLAIAAAGELPMQAVYYYLLFRLPSFLELILPLGLFLGILLAYGRLYLESEMVVLKATGMSQRRLTMYTLGPAVFTALIVASMTLFLSPYGALKTEIMLQTEKNRGEFDLISEGRFQSGAKGERVTYVEHVNGDGSGMKGVFITEPNSKGDEGQLVMVVAEQGRQYTNPETGVRYLVLDNGYRYEGNPGQANYREVSFQEYGIRLPEPKRAVEISQLDTLPTSGLMAGGKAEQAQLHWRLSLPLMTLIMALIAVPLSKTNPRQGRYAKLIPAILLYMSYLVLLTHAREYMEDDEGEATYIWLIHLVYFVLAMSLLFMKRFWRRQRPRVAVTADA